MTNVCITGNRGFIGSHLTTKCLEMGWNVLGIDNFSTGRVSLADPTQLKNMSGNYTFKTLDITQTSAMVSLFLEHQIEYVFHLAALPRVQYSTDCPVESNRANVSGTVSVLEASKIARVKRVIFSCSSSIFGGVAQFPTPEGAPTCPQSNYALQKLTGAEYCKLFSKLYGLDTCNLVYYNVFGPGQHFGDSYSTVIPAFFNAAITNKLCRIDGTGDQSRDFTYVTNVVDANILACKYSDMLSGEYFNVACGDSISVNKIFDIVQELSGENLQKQFAPARLGDPLKSLADISKIKQKMGYNPSVGFDEGMLLTWNWWKQGCK